MLNGKNIVVGVTGGIAAYKTVEVVSRLKKAGANVHVIMTQAATNFVTPLTFREISANPVITDMWAEPKKWHVEHIALANLADLFLIAPATANIIGKLASGIADDMLSTAVMATRAPVLLAPAMNTNMYQNPIVQKNIFTLSGYGYHIMEPDCGMLACGIEGPGRLPAPAVIVDRIISLLTGTQDLKGKRVLVTAGGTREPIDPVRYIGNRSSGKMGYAIAAAAARRGAEVTLISGPSFLPEPKGTSVIRVETALEMRQAVLEAFENCDLVIKAAAVADYRPQHAAQHKIKKTEENLHLILEKNPDILKELGQLKTHQFLIGFAAETRDLIDNAKDKLARKNLDMIVANDVTASGAGFSADTNIVKLIYRDGHMEEIPKMSKDRLADIILDKITEYTTK